MNLTKELDEFLFEQVIQGRSQYRTLESNIELLTDGLKREMSEDLKLKCESLLIETKKKLFLERLRNT